MSAERAGTGSGGAGTSAARLRRQCELRTSTGFQDEAVTALSNGASCLRRSTPRPRWPDRLWRSRSSSVFQETASMRDRLSLFDCHPLATLSLTGLNGPKVSASWPKWGSGKAQYLFRHLILLEFQSYMTDLSIKRPARYAAAPVACRGLKNAGTAPHARRETAGQVWKRHR